MEYLVGMVDGMVMDWNIWLDWDGMVMDWNIRFDWDGMVVDWNIWLDWVVGGGLEYLVGLGG